MNTLLSGRKEDYGLAQSEDVERRINACRNALKQQNIENLDAHLYGYDMGTVFSDLIGECEKTGDYIINVVQARLGASRNAIRFQGLQMDTDAKRVTVDGEGVNFAKVEYELLKLLLENQGKVFSADDLLSAVWPDDPMASTHTVEVNVSRIRRKLGPYADCIQTHEGGYSFQG
jgi:phosphate:Na+ symporter